jgi:hypothetical protein
MGTEIPSGSNGVGRTFRSLILFLTVMAAGLITGCAQTGGRIEKSAGTSFPPRPAGNETWETTARLEDFELQVLTEPGDACPGPDGKNMVYLGRDHKIKLILDFTHPVPAGIKPQDLIARLSGVGHPIPFTRKVSEKTFMTDDLRLDFLEPGMFVPDAGVFVYHALYGDEAYLGKRGALAVDTTPPPRPVNVRIVSAKQDRITISWDYEKAPEPGEIKEISIKKLKQGRWITGWRGFSAPPVTIDSTPAGTFRMVVLDCALNRSEAEFSSDLWTITKSGCGRNRYLAYRAAQILINTGFVREYVSPWLEEHTEMTDRQISIQTTEHLRGWVPPGIEYTPENMTTYTYDRKEKVWCAEVKGSLDRKFFMKWIKTRSGVL